MNEWGIRTRYFYKYIPLQGWQAVASALETFGSGLTRRPQEDDRVMRITRSIRAQWDLPTYQSRQFEKVSDHFISKMLQDAQTSLDREEKWQHFYDADGEGRFYATHVEILVLERDAKLYGLNISSPYVEGDEYEVGLAQYLQIERALLSTQIREGGELITSASALTYDFDELVSRLRRVLPLGTNIRGENAVRAAFHVSGVAVIYESDFFQIGYHVATNLDRSAMKAVGSVLRAQLKRDPYTTIAWAGRPLVFEIVIDINRRSDQIWKPFYKPDEKKFVLDLTDEIAKTLRK